MLTFKVKLHSFLTDTEKIVPIGFLKNTKYFFWLLKLQNFQDRAPVSQEFTTTLRNYLSTKRFKASEASSSSWKKTKKFPTKIVLTMTKHFFERLGLFPHLKSFLQLEPQRASSFCLICFKLWKLKSPSQSSSLVSSRLGWRCHHQALLSFQNNLGYFRYFELRYFKLCLQREPSFVLEHSSQSQSLSSRSSSINIEHLWLSFKFCHQCLQEPTFKWHCEWLKSSSIVVAAVIAQVVRHESSCLDGRGFEPVNFLPLRSSLYKLKKIINRRVAESGFKILAIMELSCTKCGCNDSGCGA